MINIIKTKINYLFYKTDIVYHETKDSKNIYEKNNNFIDAITYGYNLW